jgi:hypothetical protein
LKKEVDGSAIELILPEAKVNEHLRLIFTFSDTDGNPITELEPYLGSAGHVVIVSEDMNVPACPSGRRENKRTQC